MWVYPCPARGVADCLSTPCAPRRRVVLSPEAKVDAEARRKAAKAAARQAKEEADKLARSKLGPTLPPALASELDEDAFFKCVLVHMPCPRVTRTPLHRSTRAALHWKGGSRRFCLRAAASARRLKPRRGSVVWRGREAETGGCP